jgi:hypothetical protein
LTIGLKKRNNQTRTTLSIFAGQSLNIETKIAYQFYTH